MWLLVILSFSAGGIAGALCFHLMGFTTLLVPAALVLACAIGLGLHLKEDKQPQ
jgi:uncharacterized membrane protein YoaK (UPF0700 family)